MAGEEGWVATLLEPLRTPTVRQVTEADGYVAGMTAFGRPAVIKCRGKLRFIERMWHPEPLPPERRPFARGV